MSEVEDIFPASSGQEGSATSVPSSGTQDGQTGGDNGASSGDDYKSLYEELEKKLGEQGNELGGYKKFFQNVEPLLTKLDAQPELVQAIMSGKIDAKLASAALEGKVSIGDAQIVNQAHSQIKDELGKEQYKNMDSAEIEKLVVQKASEIAQGIVTTKLSERDTLDEFKQKTVDFVQSTPDFDKFADDIKTWLEENPDQDDVKVAYFAVKGQKYDEAIRSGNTELIKEAAKELALNAAGGGSYGGNMPDAKSIVDSLIADNSNPNNL